VSYNLRFYPYSGDHGLGLLTGSTKEECRDEAARWIRDHRNSLEYPVSILERGTKWELESDPDGGSMIGDSEGVLKIIEVDEPEPDDFEDDPFCDKCKECGEIFDESDLSDDGYCDACFQAIEDEEEDDYEVEEEEGEEPFEDQCEGCGEECQVSDLNDDGLCETCASEVEDCDGE
jgi:hypothetical protein